MANKFIAVETKLLKSEVFRKLSGPAKTVFLDFLMKRKLKRMKAKSGRAAEWIILNNGEIEYCYAEAIRRGIPRRTFARVIDELVKTGFIDISHSGSSGRRGDKSLYAISNRWENFGTEDFIPSSRPKDTRGGRGFQPGNTLGKYSKAKLSLVKK